MMHDLHSWMCGTEVSRQRQVLRIRQGLVVCGRQPPGLGGWERNRARGSCRILQTLRPPMRGEVLSIDHSKTGLKRILNSSPNWIF